MEGYLSSEKPISSFTEVQFGISYIATVLKKAGHQVELLVLTEDSDLETVVGEFIKSFNPRMFCLNVVATRFPFMIRTAKLIKNVDRSIYTAIGGAHAIINPGDVMSEGCFDAVCTGEGEESIVALAQMLEKGSRPSNIPNFWFLKDEKGNPEKNPNSSFISDLDKLPVIDRGIWKRWILNHDVHSLLLGRGCPFKCTYCSNHIIAHSSDGKYVRFRSFDNVIGELKEMVSEFPNLTKVYFEVETFGANLKYALGLCDALSDFNKTLEKPLGYGINLAVTKKISTNKELLQAMKKANFEWVNIGLESGSSRIRREILKRPDYENGDLIYFSTMARELGIRTTVYILMGIPTETLEEFRETIECARACDPSDSFISIFYPYPGTELHELALKQGLISKETINHHAERKVAILDLPGFSKRRIRYEFVLANYRIYKGRVSRLKLVLVVLRNIIGGFPFLDHILRSFLHQNPLGRLLKRIVTNKPAPTAKPSA